MSATPPPAPARYSPGRTWAWVLYDPANTVYPATLTFLFTPFVKSTYGELSWLGIVNFLSMAAAAVLVPSLGALADHTTRTHRYLAWATVACVVALAAWGIDLGFGWLMAWFFVANLTYNLGLLFYNSLLASVAPPERSGNVSALGVGVGYFATIVILLTLLPLEVPTTYKFPVAAGLFLFFSLPCLLFVQDQRHASRGSTAHAVRASMHSLGRTLKELPRHRALFWFLLANFCFVDVLNTAVLFFAELTESTFRPQAESNGVDLFGFVFSGEDGITQLVMVFAMALNTLALVYGLSIGRWTDRAPLAVMACSGLGLLIALVGGAMFAGHSAVGYLCTLVALGAFGLTGVWTAGRKIVILLAPPDQVGQYFGLYGITLKLSVFGGMIYGVVRDNFDAQAALLSQSPQLLLGLLFLAMVRLPKTATDSSIPSSPADRE